jgi:hypothetical protein
VGEMVRSHRIPLGKRLVGIVRNEIKVRSVLDLAAALGRNIRSLELQCRALATQPRRVLDFVWCLDLVLQAKPGMKWNPEDLLCIYRVDERTLRRLASTAGFRAQALPSRSSWLANDSWRIRY